jgi:nitroimidazol reductase NimA-like FMN-containing flavoprotein (pyridoxamine 5'-phosphate oxidase superfamily)
VLKSLIIPAPMPAKKITGYNMPEDSDHLLSWAFVAEQMTTSRHYWLSTTSADGRPHAAPVWGIWYENRIHFEGSPQTAWLRNLQRNPYIAVHLPDAEKVVMIEGVLHLIEDDELDGAAWDALDTAFQQKYNVNKGRHIYASSRIRCWRGMAEICSP